MAKEIFDCVAAFLLGFCAAMLLLMHLAAQ